MYTNLQGGLGDRILPKKTVSLVGSAHRPVSPRKPFPINYAEKCRFYGALLIIQFTNKKTGGVLGTKRGF